MRVEAVGILVVAGDKYLVVQRASGKKQAGTWAIPGGKVDPGETKLQAAVRETLEETGKDFSHHEVYEVDQIDHDFDEHDRVSYTTFKVVVDEPFDAKLNPGEHSAYRWATLQELKAGADTIDTLTDIIERVEA